MTQRGKRMRSMEQKWLETWFEGDSGVDRKDRKGEAMMSAWTQGAAWMALGIGLSHLLAHLMVGW